MQRGISLTSSGPTYSLWTTLGDTRSPDLQEVSWVGVINQAETASQAPRLVLWGADASVSECFRAGAGCLVGKLCPGAETAGKRQSSNPLPTETPTLHRVITSFPGQKGGALLQSFGDSPKPCRRWPLRPVAMPACGLPCRSLGGQRYCPRNSPWDSPRPCIGAVCSIISSNLSLWFSQGNYPQS